MMYEHLNKAKDLIKKLADLVTDLNGEDNVKESVVIEAEKFLNEWYKK